MAFQDFSINFADDLGTEVIDIFVGPERKHYVVHKQPLTSKSEYFRTLFKRGFKEAEENSIEFKEEDPAAVALMIGWVYRGVIPGMERKISPFAQAFTPNPFRNSDIPNADSIDGSHYPFAPYYEVEPNNHSGMRNAFQHIGFQPQYHMFSQEELRMTDYRLGRRYANTEAFRHQGHGLFGHAPRVPPPPPASGPAPIPTSQPGNMFGTVQPAPQVPAGAIPGTTDTTPSTTPAPSAAPARNWAATWGLQPQLSSGIFGIPLRPPQTGSVGSPFGNPRPASVSPSTQNGDSTVNSTPTQPVQGSSTSSTPAANTAAPPAPAQSSSRFAPLNPSASSQASAGSLFGSLGHNPAPVVSSYAHQPRSLFEAPISNPSVFFGPDISNSSLFRGVSPLDPNRSTTQQRNLFEDLPDSSGPGQFGYSSTIAYPPASGKPLPGIPQSQSLGTRSAEQEAQQSALIHLCLLAETILWPELYNASIEAYVRGELNLHRPIPAEHVDLIYDRTPSESTLRAYVLESMCTNRGDSLMYIELTRQYDELMEDILNKLPTLRIQEQRPPWDTNELIRSFHMPKLLAKGKEKEGQDVEVTGLLTEKEDGAST